MKSNKSGASLGAGLVILSSFFYASYGIWTKLMGNFFGGYSASALRSVVVLLILVPAALILRKFEPLNLKKNWLYILGITAASFFCMGTTLLFNTSCGCRHCDNYQLRESHDRSTIFWMVIQ